MVRTLRLEFDAKGVVKLEGLAELLKNATLEELDSTADQMKHVAKSLVRVDTGSLKQSIRKERRGDRISVRAGGYVTNPKTGQLVNYASIIESKYPFMMPAWLMVREGIVERIQERVRRRWMAYE